MRRARKLSLFSFVRKNDVGAQVLVYFSHQVISTNMIMVSINMYIIFGGHKKDPPPPPQYPLPERDSKRYKETIKYL